MCRHKYMGCKQSCNYGVYVRDDMDDVIVEKKFALRSGGNKISVS